MSEGKPGKQAAGRQPKDEGRQARLRSLGEVMIFTGSGQVLARSALMALRLPGPQIE